MKIWGILSLSRRNGCDLITSKFPSQLHRFPCSSFPDMLSASCAIPNHRRRRRSVAPAGCCAAPSIIIDRHGLGFLCHVAMSGKLIQARARSRVDHSVRILIGAGSSLISGPEQINNL
jgi:hypothetical protein